MDVALLYDVYHDLAYPSIVLAELHRVLKPTASSLPTIITSARPC